MESLRKSIESLRKPIESSRKSMETPNRQQKKYFPYRGEAYRFSSCQVLPQAEWSKFPQTAWSPVRNLTTLFLPGHSRQHTCIKRGLQKIQSDRVLKRYPKRYPNDTTNSNFRSSVTKYSFPELGGGVCGEGWGWWGKAFKGKLSLPGGWIYRHDALAYVYIH